MFRTTAVVNAVLSIALLTVSSSTTATNALSESVSFESLIDPLSTCYADVQLQKRTMPAIPRVTHHALVVSNRGHCVNGSGHQGPQKLVAELTRTCERGKNKPEDKCHVVMLNGKWVASPANFKLFPAGLVNRNRKQHQIVSVSTLGFNARVEMIETGDVTAHAGMHHFPFTAPLKDTDLPTHGVVEMTRHEIATFPGVANPWLKAERSAAIKKMRAINPSVLVAPVKTIGFGFNRGHRIAMALDLTQRLKAAYDLSVVDPVLVQRTFGVGVRNISKEQLVKLANELNVKTILVPELGHDNQQQLLSRFQLIRIKSDISAENESTVILTNRTGFSEAEGVLNSVAPLFDNVVKLVSENVSDIPVRKSDDSNLSTAANADLIGVPTPDELKQKSRTALSKAFIYQWLASLAPPDAKQLRAELNARSLTHLSSERIPKSTTAHLLTARAYAELGAVATSRALLAGRSGPASQSFLAFSRGQLREMEKTLPRVSNAGLRALLALDYSRLLRAAEMPQTVIDREARLLGYEYKQWHAMIRHTIRSDRSFRFAQNASLTGMLTTRPGSVASRKKRERSLSKIDVLTLKRAIDKQRAAAQCQINVDYCLESAFSQVLQALAIKGAINNVELRVFSQGLPVKGLSHFSAVDPILQGNPSFEMSAITVMNRLKSKVVEQSDAKEFVDRKALGQSLLSTGIEYSRYAGYQPRKGKILSAFPNFDQANARDYPYDVSHKGQMLLYGANKDDKVFLKQIEQLYFALPESVPDTLLTRPAVHKALADRFQDHHAFMMLEQTRLQALPVSDTTTNDLITLASKIIRNRPDDWMGYSTLGYAQAKRLGDYRAAVRTFLRYKGFHDESPERAVKVSNRATEVGDYFFWRGEADNARPFYEIATRLQTGAHSNFSAGQRLALLNGEYLLSISYASARAERYNNAFGLRDLLAWLFVSGNEEQGWDIFNQVHTRFANGQLWLAAQIGSRKAGKSWAENSRWLMQKAKKTRKYKHKKFAAITATGLAMMDRTVPEEASRDIEALETHAGGVTGRFAQYRFVEAVRLLQNNKREQAYKILAKELERRNSQPGYVPPQNNWLAPYAAYAVANTSLEAKAWAGNIGDARVTRKRAGLLRLLEAPLSASEDFDIQLVKAFHQGLSGMTAAAVEHLKTAMRYRPHAYNRPVHPEYQWAQACEWLYRDTGEKIYRDMALDWAKKFQRIMPYVSWPYAFEAALSTSRKDQIRAASIGLQLDPHSRRISRLPADILANARTANYALPWAQEFADIEDQQAEKTKRTSDESTKRLKHGKI